jgi:hypothetical protein
MPPILVHHIHQSDDNVDSKGNWPKAITKTDKNAVVITERTYTYF